MKRLFSALLLLPFLLFGAAPGNLRNFASLDGAASAGGLLLSNPNNINPHVVVESYWARLGKGGGEFVWNPASTEATNRFSCFKSQSPDWTAAAGRWKRVVFSNETDITEAGARGDFPTTSTEDNLALQNIIDVLEQAGSPGDITANYGTYGPMTNLIVAKTDGITYSTVSGIRIIGKAPTSSSAASQVKFVVADSSAAGIILQNTKDCEVRNINFVGMNSFFGEGKALEADFAGTFLNIENFKSSINTVSTNRYAPHVGIAIDPFSSSTPTQYPGLAAWYLGTGGASENVTIKNCSFTDLVAPWIVTPADNGGGVHHFYAENNKSLQCTYGMGFGTSLVDFRIKNHQMRDVYAAFSTADFGAQTGTIPNFDGHLKYVTYIFEQALTNITTSINIEYQNIQALVTGGAGPIANGTLMIVGSGYDGSGTHALTDDGSYKTFGAGTLTGSGTSGKLSKWTASTVLGNSIATESGTNISIAGSAVVSSLTSTNQIKITGANGTPAAPSIQFEAGLGIFQRVSDGNLYFATAGAETMALLSNTLDLNVTGLGGLVFHYGEPNSTIDANGVYSGTGSPEGVKAARTGSIYLRQGGSAGTVLYVKESGVGNTGWVAYTAGSGGTTINATDGYLPYRTSATTFGDSIAKQTGSTNLTFGGTISIGSLTNNFRASGANLIYSKGSIIIDDANGEIILKPSGAASTFIDNAANTQVSIGLGLIQNQKNNIGVANPVGTYGFTAANTYLATAGLPQNSSAVTWAGQGYGTNTATSQLTRFGSYIVTSNGADTPTGLWVMERSMSNSTPVRVFSISSDSGYTGTGTNVFGDDGKFHAPSGGGSSPWTLTGNDVTTTVATNDVIIGGTLEVERTITGGSGNPPSFYSHSVFDGSGQYGPNYFQTDEGTAGGYTGNYSYALISENGLSANGGTLYTGLGNVGTFGYTYMSFDGTGPTNGWWTGALGYAPSTSAGATFGVAGLVDNGWNGQTNVAILGSVYTAGIGAKQNQIVAYFEDQDDYSLPNLADKGVVIAESRLADMPLFIGRTNNGTHVFEVAASGVITGKGLIVDSTNMVTALAGKQPLDSDLTTWAGVTPGTGVATALGVNVGSAGAVVVNGGALGTPSSGTLTSATGLPIAGLVASTSTALGVGSVELGHATDTTIARVSAGVVSVEGVNVLTTATGQALDSDLTTIAGLTATTDSFIQSKSSAWASRTVSQVEADLQGTGLLTDSVGFRIIPQNSQSTAYTTVAADSGKHIFHPAADTTARTWTIDSNANVAYPVGTAITFVNETLGGVITIAITSDTLLHAADGTTGNYTLAASKIATALKITTTKWIISP